jgi:small-conductance mechanosensitive channel
MDILTQWISDLTGLNVQLQSKIFTSIVIIFILWLIRTIVMRIVWRNTDDVQTRYRWQKTSAYIASLIVILLVGRVWFEGVQALATYFGLLSAGLAIALKDLVSSLAGWVFIIWRSPLAVGDRIQIGEFRGDVIDIRLFKFTLLEIGNWVDADQSTGRVIHVPNSMILSDTLANYTKGFQFIWHEIPVLLTFESNWKKAKSILSEIAENHAQHFSESAEKRLRHASRKFMIFYSNLTPTVYTTVKDSGVLLTIRYLIDPKRRRSSEQEVWEEILGKFAKAKDIDFAYPTQRFYNNIVEGKTGARASEPDKKPR